MAVTFTGSWQKAQRILSDKGRIATAFKKAVVAEGRILQTEIRKALTSQGKSTGTKFEPLQRITLLIRRLRGNASNKGLLETGDLREKVDTKEISDGAFVGVPHGPVSFRGMPFSKIAEINEEGATFTVKVTPAMQALFFAALREAGVKTRTSDNSGGGGGGVGFWVIRIPPRPFLKPAFTEYSKDREKIMARIAKKLEAALR